MPLFRVVAVAGLVVAVAAPAWAETDPLTPELKAAYDAHINCAHEAANRLDDRVSDAATIARGIVAECRSFEKLMVLSATQGKSRSDIDAEAVFVKKMVEERALLSVLRRRQKSR